MPKEKKEEESFLEKVEEKVEKTAKKIAKEVKDIEEKVVEKVKDLIESEEDTKKGSKMKKKNNDKLDDENKKKIADDKEKVIKKSEKEEKIAKLKEKAKKLASEIKTDYSDLRKKVKSEEEKDTIIPIEDYLKSSIHLGTRAITPDMRPYVYKRRADSLAVFNTTLLDEKIREAGEYLAKFSTDDIVLVCKRESGEKAAELFSKTLGIRAFTNNYPAGILTNPNLSNFIEAELLLICDPWTDKAALQDAKRIKIPVMAICDTNNYTMGVDFIIPGNNKSAKSLGMILYLLAKLYAEKKKMNVKMPPISEWIEGWDSLVPPK